MCYRRAIQLLSRMRSPLISKSNNAQWLNSLLFTQERQSGGLIYSECGNTVTQHARKSHLACAHRSVHGARRSTCTQQYSIGSETTMATPRGKRAAAILSSVHWTANTLPSKRAARTSAAMSERVFERDSSLERGGSLEQGGTLESDMWL